jgi:hypothetical protein
LVRFNCLQRLAMRSAGLKCTSISVDRHVC